MGPTNFQQPVLTMICAILKYADSASMGMKQFHSHLLRVITSHVKVYCFPAITRCSNDVKWMLVVLISCVGLVILPLIL